MRYGLTFCLLMIFWIILSGRFDAFHLGLGVVSSALVAAVGAPMWFPNRDATLGGYCRIAWRFSLYTSWLLYQVILSNLHVLALAFQPNVQEVIEPQIVRFKTKLKGDFARVVFANSITLTPGTVTIRIVDDEFIVHAITSKTAAELPGEMEARVAAIFD